VDENIGFIRSHVVPIDDGLFGKHGDELIFQGDKSVELTRGPWGELEDELGHFLHPWIRRLDNDLPFSSERRGRPRAYHGRGEPRAQPAASRHQRTFTRIGVAFGCCNGLLDSSWLDAQ